MGGGGFFWDFEVLSKMAWNHMRVEEDDRML